MSVIFGGFAWVILENSDSSRRRWFGRIAFAVCACSDLLIGLRRVGVV